MRQQDQVIVNHGIERESQAAALTAGIAGPVPSLAMREISIRPLSYGYMVQVGCQTFAIETSSGLIARLSEYILNPAATEQKWKEGKLV